MYLEVYIFNASSISRQQIEHEQSLPDFPSRRTLKKTIKSEIAAIEWLDKRTCEINHSEFKGHIILASSKNRKIVYVKIFGGDDPLKVVVSLCDKMKWTSYTPENEHFLDIKMDTTKYWQEYKSYKGVIDEVFYKRNL